MPNTAHDHRPASFLHGLLDFMKVLGAQSMLKFAGLLKSQKVYHWSSFTYIFTQRTWYKLANTILAVLISAYRGGIADQTRTSYAIVGIAPSADSWMGRPFLSPATKNGAFGKWLLDDVGRWIATVSYSIGIVGAAHLWGVVDLKVWNCYRNCPALPYWHKPIIVHWV